MVVGISKSEKDGQGRKKSPKSMNEDGELTPRSTFSSSKGVKHKNALVLNTKRPNNAEYCTREPFLRYIQRLDRRVPKHIITLDEKYIHHCLELVYASAMRGTSCTSVLESLPFQMSNLSEGTNSCNFKSDLSEFVNYFPLEANIVGNGTIGTILRSEGGMNLLKSHLIDQSVSVRGRAFLTDATKSADDTVSTSLQLSISSSPEPDKKMSVFERGRLKIETEHKRHVSVSSTYTLSGHSSFSLSSNLNRGLLHCTWKAGLPHYVFCLDDCNEIYIANIIKSETPNEDGYDYIYTFYTNEASFMGKMRVSTSFKLCPNNWEIKETEFVLFGEDERDTGEVQTSTSHNSRKSKGVSKKMSEIFKTSHISRERAHAKYASTSEKPFTDLSTNFLPNLELAVIIVKDHVCVIREEPEIAGWGMNFLKKIESKDTASSIDTPPSPCDCFGNNGNCSTSTNIVIPADFHGGPRNRINGPSSVVERWRSGRCDCGGWDIGCPIMLLNTEQSNEENLSQTDVRVAGLQDSAPVMSIVNIRDGLHIIHFHPNLSTLQSLSIAVSIIHTQTVL